jgi:hypothetical protein
MPRISERQVRSLSLNSSLFSLQPKSRAKKQAPNPSTASSRYPGLKSLNTSPTVSSPQGTTAALGLPSPGLPPYQPLANANSNPQSILYGGVTPSGLARSPQLAYGVPFGLPSPNQPVRPLGAPSVYNSPSLDAAGQRQSKEQLNKNEG